ncbi:MAG: hypothetical protein QE271_01250 [Bacteriovoracaceae bacterium]|nr:hypothetical protein [Bacteriovoracaceae bacterium]
MTTSTITNNATQLVKHQQQYFASCPVGLEKILEAEIQSFQVKTTKLQRGGVLFQTFDERLFELLFGSRIASRIFKVLFEFKVKGHKDLQSTCQQIKWSSLFSTNYSFKVQTIYDFSVARLRDTEWKNSLYTSLVVKDGIMDHFKEQKDVRPNVDKNNADLTFVCHIKAEGDYDFAVSMLVDLCSEPLSHRGYRLPKMTAPLRENLAAGLIHMAGWPKAPGEALVDPFCGSGTLLIEAALIRNRVPPSFNKLKIARHTGDELWPVEKLFYFQKSEELSKNFNELLIKYYDQSQKALEKMNLSGLYGGDLDFSCGNIIKKELEKIGLHSPISFEAEDFRKMKLPTTPFCIITNPPYGERLEEPDLDGLYYELGEWLKQSARGNRAYIFTKHGPHIKSIHLKSKQKEVITNGDFDCRLLNFELY